MLGLRFLGHFVGDFHQPLHVGFAEDLIPCRALAVVRVEQNRADSPGRIRNNRVLAVPVAARREVALAARAVRRSSNSSLRRRCLKAKSRAFWLG